MEVLVLGTRYCMDSWADKGSFGEDFTLCLPPHCITPAVVSTSGIRGVLHEQQQQGQQ